MRFLIPVLALGLLACTGPQGEMGTRGVPGSDYSEDIDEIFSRLEYMDCVYDADVVLGDADEVEDAAFTEYLADNLTYAEYEDAYDVYERAYDAFNVERDRCWDKYLEESEVQ